MIRAAPGLHPVREILPPDTVAAFLVLAGSYGLAEDELEAGVEWFVDRVDRELRPDGYRLAGTFEPESQIAAGVAGFRTIRSNAWGDHLWIEDFIAGGIGGDVETLQLLGFLEVEAERLGLTQIHLDVLADEPPDREVAADAVTGLAALQGFADLPRPGDPFISPERAALHGFWEVAGRFVLKLDGDDDASKPPDRKAAVNRRRQMGRPRRPRRGN